MTPFNDTIRKRFVTSRNNGLISDRLHMQDPTNLGFTIKFHFHEESSLSVNDVIPGSLIYKPKDNIGVSQQTDSALTYLKDRKENNKHVLLEGFINELFDVSERAPWFFREISGMDSLYKVGNINRTGEEGGRIEIGTLESIDMRIMRMIDWYRKVAFDFDSMTWMLPENLRKFSMTIIITEFQPVHTQLYNSIYSKAANKQPIELTPNQQLNNNFSNDLVKTVTSEAQNVGLNIGASVLLAAYNIATGPMPYQPMFSFNDSLPIQVFELFDCEFDVLGDWTPSFADSMSVESSEYATNNLPIKFKRIENRNYWSLYDYVTRDTLTSRDVGPKGDGGLGIRKFHEYVFQNRSFNNIAYILEKNLEVAKMRSNYRGLDERINDITGGII